MALKLLKDGMEIIPSTNSEQALASFCLSQNIDYLLEWINGQYWLHSDRPDENPFTIQIDSELARHEEYFKKSSLQKELLAKAIGVKGPFRPRVLDLTAGLLGDSLLFLSFGCEVVALERHPLVRVLIESALQNSQHPALQKLTFVSENAAVYLPTSGEFDALYFDPMFEDSNPKASPRKEMRLFRHFVGEDLDAAEIFKLARMNNQKRLVVKRPRYSKALSEEAPLSYDGKATRYDVYLKKA